MNEGITPAQRAELSLSIPRDSSGIHCSDELLISLGEHAQPLGHLRLHNKLGTNCSSFRFDPAWLRHSRRFMVSPDLQAVNATQWCRQSGDGGAQVFTALNDTVPSGFGKQLVQRAWVRGLLSELGASDEHNAESMALCAVSDHARLGALRVRTPGQPFADPRTAKFSLPFHVDLDNMGAMVRAFKEDRETLRQLLLMLYGFTALGGPQPKCTFVTEDGALSVAKFFASEQPGWMPRAEVLFTTLALAAGLRTVQPRLLHPVFSPVVISPRFDRDPDGRRIPYLSARSLLKARPGEQVSWTELLAQMRLYSKNFAADAKEIWCRLVFGRLIGKASESIDEFEFLYAGNGKWQLAPGCGFRPQFPGIADKPTGGHPLFLLPPNIEALLATADQFGLKETDALIEIRRKINVLKTWKWRATEFMFNMNHHQIDAIAPLIDNTQLRQATLLVGS
ncbi:MAG TPA: HipA domain-containing protein [Polaromonas sp.]|nr:HipA domain-containing protein [Polaromonas sp.]